MQVAGVLRKYLTVLILCLGCGSVFLAAAQTTSGSKAKTAAKSEAPASESTTTAKPRSGAQDQEADAIVAVVNKDVITQRELTTRLQQFKNELRQRGQTAPDDVLMRDVLQRLIQDRLEMQEAKRLKIEVTNAMLDKAIESIGKRNNLSIAQMRKQIEASGTSWDQYREVIRREIMIEGLRQRTVDNTILISDAEVDAFLRDQKARQTGGLAALAQQNAPPPVQQPAPAPQRAKQARPNQPPIMGLAQILIRVPEGSSDDQVKALRSRAQDALARIKRGESFEKVAQAVSEGPEASRGGDMGARLVEGWPDLFLKAVANVQDGQVSGIIQSGNGFHILKVLGRAGGPQSAPDPAPAQAPAAPPGPISAQGPAGAQQGRQAGGRSGPMPVDQTKAKHILIKTTQVVSDEIAQQKLAQIRERLVEGKESFADLARRFSNDSSAPQGGDLGWLNPGETVPPFEKAMNSLKVGEVSQPVQTQFGWHIIVVDDRRTQDMAEQLERNQVRQKLFMQRSDAAFELWLQQVRNQSYIDNRLEKRLNQAKE
jgi:peptidyl-prolyl cis-trans isomerase SurA